MRKPPLIALTAFTALGASAVVGTTAAAVNNHNSALTSAKSFRSTPVSKDQLFHTHPAHPLAITRPGPDRDLRAMHDVFLQDRANLSNLTGLPPLPKVKPRPKRHVAVVSSPAPLTTSVAAPAPPVSHQSSPPAATSPAGGAWYELRMCESGDNYAEDTGNGYYGAYQFALSTWYGLGFSGLPSEAPPAVQDEAAAELQARSGWGQWPQCAAELGLY